MKRKAFALLLALALVLGGCAGGGQSAASSAPEEAAQASGSGGEAANDALRPNAPPPGQGRPNGFPPSSGSSESPSAPDESGGPAENAENGSAEAEPAADEPAGGGGGGEKALVERLFLPLILIAAALLAAAAWLLRERARRNGAPAAGAPEPPSAPEKTPVYRVGNLHNIGRRDEQQDSFCISDVRDEAALRDKGLMAVVADGMGGLQGGAAISQLVTDTFLSRYRLFAVPDADAFLYDCAKEAEAGVEHYMAGTGVDGGSTLVAVLLRGELLHFVSVGDSRIYLLRGGELRQLNHEHTYGAFLLEQAAKGEVDPDEPYTNPRRNALIAYIGMGSLNRVDRSERPVRLQKGDKVLLCSDGVFNALGGDALAAALAGDALTAAQRLEEAVLAQNLGNQDNFTGVLLEYADDA